jgi:hypothetical protein
LGRFQETRKGVAVGVNLPHRQGMKLRIGISAFVVTAVVIGCKPKWPGEEPIGGKAATLVSCDVGPSGRFVISRDSVGSFAIATATMDDIVSSCGTVSTEWESTCCQMAVIARFDYPGVHVAAEQASRDSIPRPLSRIARWEVTGDSIHIAGVGLLPTTVAGLATAFGQGWAENPGSAESDGPKAYVCALPQLAFRITVPARMTETRWLVDTSGVNREARVQGVIVVPEPPVNACAQAADG